MPWHRDSKVANRLSREYRMKYGRQQSVWMTHEMWMLAHECMEKESAGHPSGRVISDAHWLRTMIAERIEQVLGVPAEQTLAGEPRDTRTLNGPRVRALLGTFHEYAYARDNYPEGVIEAEAGDTLDE